MTIAAATRTVREAVAVFDHAEHLQDAIDELLSSGFHRAELSLLAGEQTVREKLGRHDSIAALADNPDAPRTNYVSPEALGDAEGAVIGALMYVGAMAATGAVVASGGTLAALIIGTTLAGGGGALIGVVMANATHNPRWDAVGSIAIGLLLVAIAIVLAIEMKGLLIGEAASSETENAISTAIAASPHVVSLIHLRTQHIGPDELLVGAKIDFGTSLDLSRLSQAINEVETAIRKQVSFRCVIYLEPDLRVEEARTE